MLAARNFRQGFDTTEYLACAIVDLEAHLDADEALDAREFERDALARLGMPREIILRHRLCSTSPTSSPGESYAAGYFNYIWADVLSADAARRPSPRKRQDGFYDKDLAQKAAG